MAIWTDTQADGEAEDHYQETDIFAWANNLVQYVDELQIELYFFNKNYVVYKVNVRGEAAKQLRVLFIDEILEFILGGAEKGLLVRDFEMGEAEDMVLQRTRVAHVTKLTEVLHWLRHQAHEIEVFQEAEHDLKRMKGAIVVVTHPEIDQPFYVCKTLPASRLMKGSTAWLFKDGAFRPFDQMSALKIPSENQLLVVGQDLFVFNQAKLKALFGYDAKLAVIAAQKVIEIQAQFKLSFPQGTSLQTFAMGKPAIIKKLQSVETRFVTQTTLLYHAEDMGIELMLDEIGAIVIANDKDMTQFVNLINDDYIESPMTGRRYEILRKRVLKSKHADDDLV